LDDSGNWLFFSLSSEDIIEDFVRIFKVKNFIKFLSLKLSDDKVFNKSPCLSRSLKIIIKQSTNKWY